MENPIKMDDLGVPLFLETPIPNIKIRGIFHHCYVAMLVYPEGTLFFLFPTSKALGREAKTCSDLLGGGCVMGGGEEVIKYESLQKEKMKTRKNITFLGRRLLFLENQHFLQVPLVGSWKKTAFFFENQHFLQVPLVGFSGRVSSNRVLEKFQLNEMTILVCLDPTMFCQFFFAHVCRFFFWEEPLKPRKKFWRQFYVLPTQKKAKGNTKEQGQLITPPCNDWPLILEYLKYFFGLSGQLSMI